MPKHKRITHHPIVKSFGAALRQERKQQGLSQSDLALKAGINIGYLGRLERGESAIGLDLIARLAESLSIAPEALVRGFGPAEEPLARASTELVQRVQKLIKRADLAAIHSLLVVVNLMDGGLARNIKTP